MPGDMEREPVRRLRSTNRIPPVLSVALVGAAVGLVVGLGLGSRLGGFAPASASPAMPTLTPIPTPPPTPAGTLTGVSPDLQADAVSPRLEQAFDSVAPGGWAVCSLDGEVVCRELVSITADPRVPPSEYGLGWYGRRDLTSVTVSPGHLVAATTLGEGAVAAWLSSVGPGDVFLGKTALTPIEPGGLGTYYFDLGSPAAGHWVVEIDFQPVAQAGEYHMTQTYAAGFIVG
jgi:hypothetical protein